MMLRVVLVACLLVLTTSCRPKYQPQTAIVDPGPPQRVPPEIRVLDPGMTPRVPLRYNVSPGQTEVLYLELVMLSATVVGGQGQQSGMPPVQLEVKMGPAEPTPEGFIRHAVRITQVRLSDVADEMEPAAREQLENMLEPLLRVQGWSEMDAQGRIRRSEFRGLKDVPPRLSSMLGNIRTALLTVPFPSEPVGVRSRWEVDRKVQLSGIWVDQTVTYDLMEMNQGKLKLQISARQSAPPQAIGSGRLEAYQASVIGSSVVRLGFFTPFSEAESTSQMRINTYVQGRPQLVRVETKVAVRVYPAEAAREFGARTGTEEEPEPAQDPRKVTDPGKQELRWMK